MQSLLTRPDMLKKAVITADVVYQGEFYTIAKAEAIFSLDGKPKKITAEGIARRSANDEQNYGLGSSIAIGRAQKALDAKIRGLVKGNNIYRLRKGRKIKDLMVA